MTCDSLLALDVTEGTLAELAQRYRDARWYAYNLTQVADALELELAARMETDDVPVPGVGLLMRRAEKRSTWKDEYSSQDFRRDVSDAIVRKIAVDIGTGELDPIKRNIAAATMQTALEVIPAFSSVKAGGRRLGIDPNDYRVVSEVIKVAVEDEGALT